MIKEFEKRLITSLILIPLSIFFIIKGSIFFIFFLSIIFLVTSYEWVVMSKKNNLLKFSGMIFLLFSFYSAFEVRGNENYKDFLFIIMICIFTDIGGYLCGKIFKGPKLTKISPNKTLSGCLGSFLLSIFISHLLLDYIFNTEFSNNLLIGFLISLSVQIGDLFFSYLKRKAVIKNTGNILPGHGGILDRIDGILLGIPTGLIYVSILIFTG